MTTPATTAGPDTGQLATEAQQLLARLVGDPAAEFRDGQLEAVTELVESGARVLVVQRTGWGKSAVYFVATALVRARGGGPTLIVSPLLALMRDQVDAARRAASTWSRISASSGETIRVGPPPRARTNAVATK